MGPQANPKEMEYRPICIQLQKRQQADDNTNEDILMPYAGTPDMDCEEAYRYCCEGHEHCRCFASKKIYMKQEWTGGLGKAAGSRYVADAHQHNGSN